MAPKMPAPITAPIASITRSPAPRTRFNECVESGASGAAIGLRANSVMRVRVEAVGGLVGRDGGSPEGRTRRRRARCPTHQFRFALQIAEPVESAGAGEGVGDVEQAVGREGEALRPSHRVRQRANLTLRADPIRDRRCRASGRSRTARPTGSSPGGKAATLGGSVANGFTAPSRTLKMVPDRSPTYIQPSSSKARPQATPRSDATCAWEPSSATRYTAPSNRLEM